jgi:hypothetical protein
MLLLGKRNSRRRQVPPPFDLMVDDIEVARRDHAAKGLWPSDISKEQFHDSFHLAGPDGYDFMVVSSRAGGRIVYVTLTR